MKFEFANHGPLDHVIHGSFGVTPIQQGVQAGQKIAPMRGLGQRAHRTRSRSLTVAALVAIASVLPACADAAQTIEPVAVDEGDVASLGSGAEIAATVEGTTTIDVATSPSALTLPYASEGQGTTVVGKTSAAPSEAVSSAVPPAPVARVANPVPVATMRTSGSQVLDSCGNVFVGRGVEQAFGEQLPEGNDWGGLLEQIADSGVNAVRILAGTDTLDVADVDALLQIVGDRGLVAYVTPYGNEGRDWLAGNDVRAMLAKHERYIIIDAFGEPTFDDRDRFLAEAVAAIGQVRSWGYRVPLTVTANQFGRDLPSILALGAQIVASDPLSNTILGWQAYWGSNGYYQETYGMSLTEGVAAAAGAPFPVQLGLDRITDFPSVQTADYGSLLSATEANGIGWLWWDWYNPYGNENNLTENGDAGQLTPTGRSVVSTHGASIQKTSKLACSAPRPVS